ncbi:hypothetical protein COL05_11875 [Bacillus sp. AFS059628]|uniref:hypothetical protein n=1 Tax=Bacillus sp. AFS059628 TaxID=2033508 RepID=UPI000BF56CEE|nr:hypothetical protein [Bacillus sp. AFS059628]PFV82193.1 hypothetical protein COL05_11875 [Bacillus sp. AFS059628]
MFKKIFLSGAVLMGVLGVSTIDLSELGIMKAEAAISDATIQKVSIFGNDYYNGSNVPGYATGTFYIVGDANVTYTIKCYEFGKLIASKDVTTKGLRTPVSFNMEITEGNEYRVTHNGKVISTFTVRGH